MKEQKQNAELKRQRRIGCNLTTTEHKLSYNKAKKTAPVNEFCEKNSAQKNTQKLAHKIKCHKTCLETYPFVASC